MLSLSDDARHCLRNRKVNCIREREKEREKDDSSIYSTKKSLNQRYIGIHRIREIEAFKFTASNINRDPLYLRENVGRSIVTERLVCGSMDGH